MPADLDLDLVDLLVETEPIRRGPSFLARHLRLAAGVTQEEAAEMLGVTVGTIANYEHGRSAPAPRLRKAYRRYLAQLAASL